MIFQSRSRIAPLQIKSSKNADLQTKSIKDKESDSSRAQKLNNSFNSIQSDHNMSFLYSDESEKLINHNEEPSHISQPKPIQSNQPKFNKCLGKLPAKCPRNHVLDYDWSEGDICNICGIETSSKSFYCSKCHFYICIMCSNQPTTCCLKHHELKKVKENEFTCDVCETDYENDIANRCNICDYDVCKKCFKKGGSTSN